MNGAVSLEFGTPSTARSGIQFLSVRAEAIGLCYKSRAGSMEKI